MYWVAGACRSPLTDAFVLQHEIGRGKYGSCLRAVCRRTGAAVAVKRVNKAEHPKCAQAVAEEVACGRALAASAGGCSSIARLYGVWEDGSFVSLVMELCRGEDLFEVVQKREAAGRPYSEREIVGLMAELLRGLDFMHANGVVHRDIKPENLIVYGEQLKIIDLGLATRAATRLKTKMGTPYYVAPEVLRGHGYGQLCDMWSAGVVLYVLLCGQPPFNARSDRKILRLVKEASHESACFAADRFLQAPAFARDLVRRLMAPEAQRLTARSALRHSLFSRQRSVLERVDGLPPPAKCGLSLRKLCLLLSFRKCAATRNMYCNAPASPEQQEPEQELRSPRHLRGARPAFFEAAQTAAAVATVAEQQRLEEDKEEERSEQKEEEDDDEEEEDEEEEDEEEEDEESDERQHISRHLRPLICRRGLQTLSLVTGASLSCSLPRASPPSSCGAHKSPRPSSIVFVSPACARGTSPLRRREQLRGNSSCSPVTATAGSTPRWSYSCV